MAVSDDDSNQRGGVISHIITREDLRPGDHIYCWGTLYTYAHHGIYTGNPLHEVIHFAEKSGGFTSFPGATCTIQACTLEVWLYTLGKV